MLNKLLVLALLVLSSAASAAEPPAPDAARHAEIATILMGNWVFDGVVNLSGEGPQVENDEKRLKLAIEIGKNVAAVKAEDGSIIMLNFRVLNEKPTGIQLEMNMVLTGPQNATVTLVVLKDGIVICDNMQYLRGPKLHRADGKPVGLAISTLATAKKAVSDPARPSPVANQDLVKAFSAEIQQISFQRQASFENGDLTALRTSANTSLQMQVHWAKDSAVVLGQDGETVVEEALTDAGENLAKPKRAENDRHHYSRGGERNDPPLWIQAELATPTKPVKSFKILRGVIPLRCETKAGSILTCKNIASLMNKPQAIPETADSVIITASKEKTLTYTLPTTSHGKIKAVEILDSKGQALRSRNGGYDGNGETMTCTSRCETEIPQDATVRFILLGEVVTVPVPFSFKDVPLVESEDPVGAGLF